MWVGGCAHVCWCGCLCGGQKSGSIVFLNHSPALQELTCWLDRMANGLWESPVSAINRFFMSAGDLDSESLACAGSTIPTEAGPTQEISPELHALFTYRRISH